MYKKEDYLKLVIGGFTIGILFLIACVYCNNLGLSNGYRYAKWSIDNNMTLTDEINLEEFDNYKFETRPRYKYSMDYYRGLQNIPAITDNKIRSVKTDLYSPREKYVDDNYVEYLRKINEE